MPDNEGKAQGTMSELIDDRAQGHELEEPGSGKPKRGLPPLWITTLVVFLALPFTTGPCGSISGAEYVGKAVNPDRTDISGAPWWVVVGAICIVAGTIVAFGRSRWAHAACTVLAAVALGCIGIFGLTFGWDPRKQASFGLGATLAGVLLCVLTVVNGLRVSSGQRSITPAANDPP
jgi:hypothetical protein